MWCEKLVKGKGVSVPGASHSPSGRELPAEGTPQPHAWEVSPLEGAPGQGQQAGLGEEREAIVAWRILIWMGLVSCYVNHGEMLRD